MGKVSKGPEETLRSLCIHGRWKQFPEVFWSIRRIPAHLSYKGVQMSAFWSNKVQANGRNSSKGAPAVTSDLSNGQRALYWPEQGCSPLHPHGFASKPLPQYFRHPFSCWSQGGAIDILCAEVWLWGGCGVVMRWGHISLHTSLWSWAVRGMGTGGALQGGPALPSACPGLGEHSI